MKRHTLRQIPMAWRGVDADRALALAGKDFARFGRLVATEATRQVRPEVTVRLESPAGLRPWCDALRWMLANARTAAYWARYNRDAEQQARAVELIAALERRLATAIALVETGRTPPPVVDPDAKARGRLVKLVCRRALGDLIRAELRATGCDPERYEVPDDPAQMAPWAERHGWLRVARNDDVAELLDMDDAEFMDAVVDDIVEQDDRDHGLRRLLVLHRWGQALLELRAKTVRRENLTLRRNGDLTELPRGVFTWPEDDFAQLMRSRRFVAGINQRIAEQQHRFLAARELAHSRATGAPERAAARDAVTKAVTARHPEVLAAIRAVYDPYVTDAGVLGALYVADPRVVNDRATAAGRLVLESVTQGRVA